MADVKICDKCRRIIGGEASDKAVFAVWFGTQVDLCYLCASSLRQIIRRWLEERP